MLKKLRKNKKGFTLIELIVVIAILAILSAIAVPRLLGTVDTAKTSAEAATVRTLNGATALYLAEEGHLLADFTGKTEAQALAMLVTDNLIQAGVDVTQITFDDATGIWAP